MAKTRAPNALEELEGSADRLAHWIRDHAVWVVAAVVLCIAAGAGFSVISARQEAAEDAAALVLAEARDAYREAMGAPAGSFEVPELANPEASREIRAEFIARFREIADAHAGTVAATLARLEAADLRVAQGDPQAARAELEQARAEAGAGTRLRGVVLQRLALVLEQAGDPAAAAEAYAAAGEIEAYPLRHWALADAARCFASAGDDDRALALLERVQSEAPEFPLPDHHRTLLRELRAGAG